MFLKAAISFTAATLLVSPPREDAIMFVPALSTKPWLAVAGVSNSARLT